MLSPNSPWGLCASPRIYLILGRRLTGSCVTFRKNGVLRERAGERERGFCCTEEKFDGDLHRRPCLRLFFICLQFFSLYFCEQINTNFISPTIATWRVSHVLARRLTYPSLSFIITVSIHLVVDYSRTFVSWTLKSSRYLPGYRCYPLLHFLLCNPLYSRGNVVIVTLNTKGLMLSRKICVARLTSNLVFAPVLCCIQNGGRVRDHDVCTFINLFTFNSCLLELFEYV